jgi:hypothetical protein
MTFSLIFGMISNTRLPIFTSLSTILFRMAGRAGTPFHANWQMKEGDGLAQVLVI